VAAAQLHVPARAGEAKSLYEALLGVEVFTDVEGRPRRSRDSSVVTGEQFAAGIVGEGIPEHRGGPLLEALW
jgi:hypothetical protein